MLIPNRQPAVIATLGAGSARMVREQGDCVSLHLASATVLAGAQALVQVGGWVCGCDAHVTHRVVVPSSNIVLKPERY